MVTSAAILVVASITLALAVPHTHVIHEQRDVTSPRWAKRDRVVPEKKLPMRIALAQSNLDTLHDLLMDVSHPSSLNYGKHWTADEVVDRFQPSSEAVDAVTNWLIDGGIPAQSIVQSENKAWLHFHAPSRKVEALLHADYHEYQDALTGGVLPACERYYVPADIQKHIDYIHPGIRLVSPRTNPSGGIEKRAIGSIVTEKLPSPTSLKTCDKAVTAACIAALYNITEGRLANPNNSMGIFESELDPWNQVELNRFFTAFASRIPNGTHPIDHNIDGGMARTNNISLAGPESTDIQLSYPIVYPQSITVFNVDDLHYQSEANDTYTWGFNTLLDAIDGSYCTYKAYGEKGDLLGIDPTYPDPGPGGYNSTLQCGVFKPTNVISFSYAGWEADVPISYQLRQCNEFAKLALQGTTFVFASGDSGVGDYPDTLPGQGFNGPTGCLGPDRNIYNPAWPLTCPYVTGVGGTQINNGDTIYDPQHVFFQPFEPRKMYKNANGTSGGGFSNIHPIPDYQKKALDTYFTQHNPPQKSYCKLATDDPSNPYALPNLTALAGNTGGVYNRAGRGFPDVAANAVNIAAFFGPDYLTASGTSGAAPVFASIINRINEERLAVGKKPVGFINPVLYQHPEILTDITLGSNPGCYQPGFNATPGWDPVTGLGTPNFPKMLELWMSLP